MPLIYTRDVDSDGENDTSPTGVVVMETLNKRHETLIACMRQRSSKCRLWHTSDAASLELRGEKL